MQRMLTSPAWSRPVLAAGPTLLAPGATRPASRCSRYCRSLFGGLALLALTSVTSLPRAAAQSAPALPNRFIIETLQANGRSMPYTVWLPSGYTDQRQWPVILFLQGFLVPGSDGILPVAGGGISSQLWLHPERFPCLVVMPQLSPLAPGWAGAWNDLALQALEAVVEKYGGDRSRLYLTGISLGGNGAWTVAAAHPELFAAAMPCAGYVGNPGPATKPPKTPSPAEMKAAQALKSLPLWVFHGAADPNVSPGYDRQTVALIQAEGNPNIHYTEYPGVGHDVWDIAYGDPQVIAWLFTQKH